MSDRDDIRFMIEALAQARLGRGAVEPNPPVGAVLVRDGVILSRGCHGRFGGPHAEIEAFRAARAAGVDVRGATMYVTLEPCCHHGKTPPCTDAIIQACLARVVAAMEDPDRQVAGKGLAALRSAGITVDVGVGRQDAEELLAGYIKLRRTARPWVICKWAQTADGFLAKPAGQGRWVSGEEARKQVHELRGLCDGVLVGVRMILKDDPLLNNRSGRGRQPTRVVLDSNLQTPLESQLIRSARQWPAIIATNEEAGRSDRARELRRAGVELLELPAGGRLDLSALLDKLGGRQWTYLLVEGGPMVLNAFISAGLADELLVYCSPQSAGAESGYDLPRFDIEEISRRMYLPQPQCIQVGGDLLKRYVLKQY